MKYGKRQLILASLVLALGAAVYLNWQFADADVPTEPPKEEDSLGAAQLVNSNYVETVSDNMDTTGEIPLYEYMEPTQQVAAAPESALSEARLNRQTARDEALELLDDVLQDSSADSTVKEAAIDQMAKIAQSILIETNIESLLQAKGIADSVAYLSDTGCSLVVAEDLEDDDVLLILQEIVVNETGLPVDCIKIISAL